MTNPTISQAAARPSQDGDSRQVIARAATLLRALESAPQGLTIAELARAAALPRTTVTRLAAALQAEGLVATDGRRLGLGPALLRMAAAMRPDARALVRPHLERLARDSRETVDLWVERDAFVEIVDEVVSDQEVRVAATPGTRLPLHSTAPGKALLAARDDAQVASRLARVGLPMHTARTLTSTDGLMQALAEVRRTGLAVDEEEHADDVSAIAMVVDLGLPERYAIAVAAPARRFRQQRERLQAALRGCVEAIHAQTMPAR